MVVLFFFFNDTATTEIYTLSLHDALPISRPTTTTRGSSRSWSRRRSSGGWRAASPRATRRPCTPRSEEHTSELQSRQYLVCRLLLEKKNNLRLVAVRALYALNLRRAAWRV